MWNLKILLMKKIYITLLSFLVMMPLWAIISPSRVYEDEAVNYVLNKNSGRDMDVYIGDLSETQWLVFCDLEPLKGWEHNCLYYYIDKQKTARLEIKSTVFARKLPPNGIELIPKSVKNRVTKAPQNIKVPKLGSNATNTRTYAVILSGGYNKYANYERYWNDCSFIYQTLINKYLIPKENTYVAIADGTNPAADMNCGGYFKSSPLDLDFDGSPDLKYAATKANVINIFNELSRKMTEQDHLFFFVIDHGGTNDNNSQSYINLWNQEELQDYELAQLLDRVKAGSMNIVLGQCFSGGFIDNIAKKGRVIATASTGKQSSWACSDIPYDEFVYHWTSAVARRTAYGVTVSSDVDYSGHVTMDEAFSYAQRNDRKNETPMYNSTPLSIGEDLAFDKSPELVDLYIRDNFEDTGKEPNKTTDNSWNSPDVWVRNQADDIEEHENPYYTLQHPVAHIYVKVTNRGKNDYVSKNQYLHVYWAKASTGLSMNAWRGKEVYKGYVTGYHIRPQLIDATIPAGKSHNVMVNWTLPNDLLGPESDNATENHHFCIFARISDKFDDTDDDDLILHNRANILGSNKLAQKNLSIIQKEPGKGLLATVFVRNTIDATRNYSLEIRPHETADRDLFSIARVNMQLSQPMLRAWQRGGTRSSMVAYSPSVSANTLQLQSADSKIQGINLGKNEFEKISLKCDILNPYVIYTKKYAIDLIQKDEATGEIIGGETFIIDPGTLTSLRPIEIHPVPILTGQYKLTAESQDNINDYTWTDKAGNIIGNSKEVVVSPTTKNNEYMVMGAKDGVLEQASIKLEQVQGIKSVSPSPATNYVDIILKEPADNDLTRIKVQSVQDNNMVIEKEIAKNNSQVRIELDNWPNGVIIIQLISNNDIIDNAKIIKN